MSEWVPSMARIEDYALIGDYETAALVGRNGSIDWLCLPRFDSDSCFGRLLGDEKNGYWRICPIDPGASERRYLTGRLILETVFINERGRVRVIDFMPPKTDLSKVSESLKAWKAKSRCGANLWRASIMESPSPG